jgi:hypothetical protein
MKLRNLLILGAGIGIGYTLASRLHEDDPDVVKGPQRTRSSGSSGLTLVTGSAHRLADQASAKSVEVIRRARGAIRTRLDEYEIGDAAWN